MLKRILLLARSALISCIVLGGKGHSRDDIPQTLVSYLYSIYSSVNSGCGFFFFLVGQILHPWHWSRRFLTDYSVFWLICNRQFFTRKLYSVWNYVLWMFSLLPTFLRWPGFLFQFFFFLTKLGYFLPLSLIRRLTSRLTETTVEYLNPSNWKDTNLGWTVSKMNSWSFFRNKWVVSLLNCDIYTQKSLNFCNCSVKYNLNLKVLSWRTFKKCIQICTNWA